MMKSNLALGAVAFALLAGLGAPAFAASSLTENSSYNDDFSEGAAINALAARGVHAVNVETWGTELRAVVVDKNGEEHVAFFDRDTFQPAGANVRNTRVLTKLDVGQPSTFNSSPESLASNNDD